jgi:hypothetical protein
MLQDGSRAFHIIESTITILYVLLTESSGELGKVSEEIDS